MELIWNLTICNLKTYSSDKIVCRIPFHNMSVSIHGGFHETEFRREYEYRVITGGKLKFDFIKRKSNTRIV